MIKELIIQERDAYKMLATRAVTEGKRLIGGDYWRLLDHILIHGQPFTGQKLPSRYRRRPMKACYYNAWELVRSSKTLRYVEGKCASARLPFPFDHAWAIDSRDRVIDPTLRDNASNGQAIPDTYEYFGVIFSRDQLPNRYDELVTPLQKRVGELLSLT